MKHHQYLKQHIFSRSGIVILTVIAVMLALGTVVFAVQHQTDHATIHDTNTAKTAASSTQDPEKLPVTATNNTGSTSSSSAATGSTDADNQAAIATANKPITDACSLLTLSVAKQLLGDNATVSTPGDTSSMQATDTNLSTCAYRSSSSTVQLIIRTPTSSLGTSENATAFGSAKPSDAVSVSGYSQPAYWDPNRSTLNILGDNNWYVVTRGPSGTQTDAEAVATLLKSGF